jgi:hypothetical protein
LQARQLNRTRNYALCEPPPLSASGTYGAEFRVMLDPEFLSKLRYEIFQIGEVAGEILLVAYAIKKGFQKLKLWPRKISRRGKL